MDATNTTGLSRDQTLVRLVNEHQSALLRICYVVLRDEELARDAVQETFLKAYRTLEVFRGACSEKTWLTKIALNTCRSMRRSAWFRHMDRRITPEDLPQPAYSPFEEEQTVMCDILLLPGKYREVITLYYLHDMTMSEIAQTLGVSAATVSNRLKRARQTLRSQMERRLVNDESV